MVNKSKTVRHGPALPAAMVLEGQIEPIGAEDMASLAAAVACLESTSLLARFSAIAGQQIDLAARFVPARFQRYGAHATHIALRAALRMALTSLNKKPQPASRQMHRGMAAVAGAAGGAFGLAGLAVELPVSTTLMLRAIADIARSEGEDLANPEAALACLEVFALGGAKASGAALESSYFAVRTLLAQSVSEATRFVLSQRVIDETAPVLVKFIAQIAARFGIGPTILV